MNINEAAKRLNVSKRTIRFYEEKGLLSPQRGKANSYRIYTERELWRLQTVIALREIGLGVEEIRRALGNGEGSGDDGELLRYLEIQRAHLFAAWLEYKEQLKTTEAMIDAARRERTLPLERLHALADGLKRLRETRSSWKDVWDFDRRASSHDEETAAAAGPYPHYEATLDTIHRWTRPHGDEIGLDIGTGTGNLAGRFAAGGCKMAAIDQSREMLAKCREKFPLLETKLGNAMAIPYLDGRFDFAVSSFALHHLTDGQKLLALAEIRRVLGPRGRICIADFMLGEEDEPLAGGESPHEGFIPPLSLLADWLEDAGYVAKWQRLSGLVHIVYAVPIR
ncbi:MAG: MerR family transcriptional regulator [Paenibacillaceae bacterium]|nr:MerR family transcriptional regulator [Paenibacillaceae bacterium]